MSNFAIGHYLTIKQPVNFGSTEYRFQNFFIDEDKDLASKSYSFVPFGFSGISVNRSGDNTEQNLVFPNTDLSRGFADLAIQQAWVARVSVVHLTDLSATDGAPSVLCEFVGQVSSGGWQPETISLSLSTVLDAVGATVPARTLRQDFVGNLPITGNVSL